MTTLTQPPLLPPTNRSTAAGDDGYWRLSVGQYHAMIESGILKSDDPVELLAGLLVRQMPKNPLRRAVTRLMRIALEGIVPSGWYVDSQEPITTGDSEPEPDAVVVRGETTDYLDRHPPAASVGLVVEIAESSLSLDRSFKKRVYASSGIPRYWVVNLIDRTIEAYSEPNGQGDAADYRVCVVRRAGESLPVVFDGVEVGQLPVDVVFPQ